MQYKAEIKKLPKSEVEIRGEISAPLLDEARKKALKRFGEKLDLPGFRKGHVPESVVLERVSEREILEEAAQVLLNDFYPKILEENKLDTIGKPKVSITKLALGNPLEFTVTTALLPEFKLPDYRKIATEAQNANREAQVEPEATEKEIDDVLLQIRKNKAHHDWHRAHEGREHNHLVESEDSSESERPDLEKEENLPKLDDEFAKNAGNFKDLNELREKVKENIIAEKKFREVEKKRVAMIDAILAKTEIELPEVIIESEIEKSLAQLKDEVSRVGAKFEDYLKETKKTEEDLKKDLRENSEKKAKIQLIFNKIALTEKLEPNKEILEHETKQILEHYPGASEQNARIYVATQLLNQEVLKLLEKETPSP